MPRSAPIKDKYRCDLCEVSFANKTKLKKHSDGAKHKEAVKSQQAESIVSRRLLFNVKNDPEGCGIPFEKCEELKICVYGECYECQLGLVTADIILKHTLEVHNGVNFFTLSKKEQQISKAAWDTVYAKHTNS